MMTLRETITVYRNAIHDLMEENRSLREKIKQNTATANDIRKLMKESEEKLREEKQNESASE